MPVLRPPLLVRFIATISNPRQNHALLRAEAGRSLLIESIQPEGKYRGCHEINSCKLSTTLEIYPAR